MSTLNKLRFVSSVRETKSKQSPVATRRSKLSARIEEQIALVQAALDGRKHVVMQRKTKVNKQTGERSTTEREKQIKQWYWNDAAGKLVLEPRYGAQPLEISKGKNAIQVVDMKDLLATLQLLNSAAQAGELDAPVAEICARKAKSKAA